MDIQTKKQMYIIRGFKPPISNTHPVYTSKIQYYCIAEKFGGDNV